MLRRYKSLHVVTLNDDNVCLNNGGALHRIKLLATTVDTDVQLLLLLALSLIPLGVGVILYLVYSSFILHICSKGYEGCT